MSKYNSYGGYGYDYKSPVDRKRHALEQALEMWEDDAFSVGPGAVMDAIDELIEAKVDEAIAHALEKHIQTNHSEV